jgi:4-amino-4-deoxy-L-arabinose transferase-like glycosyltransferase
MTSDIRTASAARGFASRIPWPGVLLVVAVWAVLFLPTAGLQNLHLEEGRRALLARDLLQRHDWLDPEILGTAYLKKPPLLPLLMAFVGWLTGGVSEWAVRLPPLLATLGMALAVYWLIRAYASPAGALFGALATMLTPMVMLKAGLGETDTTVTAFSFLAFALFWRGESTGGPTVRQWLLCGLAMGLAALTKGPVPLVYPVLGILAVRLSRHGWRGLGGLLFAVVVAIVVLGVWVLRHVDPGSIALWKHEMRFDQVTDAPSSESGWRDFHLKFALTSAVQSMPTLILALPALVPAWRRRLDIAAEPANALALYALLGTLVLLAANAEFGRYAMPAVPALGAAAALVFEHLRLARPRLVKPAAALLYALGGFVFLANNVVMPLRLDVLQRNQRAAAEIDRVVERAPAPLFIVDDPAIDYNVVFYLKHPASLVPANQRPAGDHAWLLIGGRQTPLPGGAGLGLPSQPAADVRSREAMRLRLYRL